MEKTASAIKIEHVSKRYIVGEHVTYRRLTESVMNVLRHPVKAVRGMLTPGEAFWALRDINLEVAPGEIIGVIGRNGAGKTTLLKILSRITWPTEGRITVVGRIGALLEVGTGFHPELTGRENILFNGAILGMATREIRERFDEIVEFSGVEDFLDTPVKRYSSGMAVRLAFAIAAHLRPEILLVDEVLAVGDAEFQKKCLGRMRDVSEGGRTVIFVSHNMDAVQNLCQKVVLLREGRIAEIGEPREVIGGYLSDVMSAAAVSLEERQDRHGLGNIRFTGVHFLDAANREAGSLVCGEDVSIVLEYVCPKGKPEKNVLPILNISEAGENLIQLDTMLTDQTFASIPPAGKMICRIPRLPLISGMYSLSVAVRRDHILEDAVADAVTFSVSGNRFYSSGRIPAGVKSKVLIDHDWQLQEK
ncbi:ABC transporter ATP-binding protein [Chloroflexota bacterium]